MTNAEHDFGPSAKSIIADFCEAQRTIAHMLAHQAERLNNRIFVKFGDQAFSFAQIAARAARRAASLRGVGIGKGDRVAIICPNRIEFIDLFFACAWVGAIAVPINHSSRGGQLQYILQNSGARLLVVDADLVDALAYIDRDDVAVETLWVLPRTDGAAAPLAPSWPCSPLPAMTEEALDAVASLPSDLAAIIYTSGTTGPSKGVCCPHAQFFWWGLNGVDVLEIDRDDILLTTLPLFHINALGSVFQALLSGATLVVLDRFSARGFAPALHQHGATITYLLGAMVPILLATPSSDVDASHQVRRALGPGVPKGFLAEFNKRFGIGLIDGYGSTETNFIIGEPLADQRPGAMGRIRPGFEARVVDSAGRPLPSGEPGELVVRSFAPSALCAGYFLMPEATAQSVRDGWFHTGDRVYREDDGRFFFMDRMKDAIRRRGENISAYEVEQVLLSHPAVANAAVYPVPSELAEDEVMAAIILNEGTSLAPEALLDFCLPRMSYFSVPRYLLFPDDLPRTDNGKVQKFKLREQGVTPETWDREAAGYKVSRPQRGTA